jgi:hypothetical protein
MGEELMDGRRVATGQASATLAARDERVDESVVELMKVTSTTNQPFVELSEQLQL